MRSCSIALIFNMVVTAITMLVIIICALKCMMLDIRGRPYVVIMLMIIAWTIVLDITIILQGVIMIVKCLLPKLRSFARLSHSFQDFPSFNIPDNCHFVNLQVNVDNLDTWQYITDDMFQANDISWAHAQTCNSRMWASQKSCF